MDADQRKVKYVRETEVKRKIFTCGFHDRSLFIHLTQSDSSDITKTIKNIILNDSYDDFSPV